jgi:hypothetical protein
MNSHRNGIAIMDNKQKWMKELADYFNETRQHLQKQHHQHHYQHQQQQQLLHITSNANYTTLIEPTTEWFHSVSTLILLTLYGIVVFAGIFGNASLIITLFSQPSGRLRNPLLVALCLADLLVSGVSAPITIVMLVLAHKTWTFSSIGCKAIHYMQVSILLLLFCKRCVCVLTCKHGCLSDDKLFYDHI